MILINFKLTVCFALKMATTTKSLENVNSHDIEEEVVGTVKHKLTLKIIKCNVVM